MTQTIPEKAEALCSLLPLLDSHLSLIPGAQTVPRYGDSQPEPGPPQPGWASCDCDGHCPKCEWDPDTAEGIDRCRGEAWERQECYMRRAYRMGEVRRVYVLLETERPYLHRAVRMVYVEPADERSECISEPARIMRGRVAEDGVEWMAECARGELTAFGDVTPLDRAKRKRENIARMLAEGCTYEVISAELRCSSKTIASVSTSKGTPVVDGVR